MSELASSRRSTAGRADAGDELVARLEPAEARILALLLDQLEQLLTADAEDVAGDPVLDRLLPAGHRSDPELAADYRELTESALRAGKAEDLATVRAGLLAVEPHLSPALGQRRADDGQVVGLAAAQ